jgi:mRNA (guanine-N7-)-methyltransferase
LFIKEKGQADPEVFSKHLPKDFKFDIISAQFCIHYFFESEKSVRNFLQNISGNLNKNGLFFATFPDSKVIAKKFHEFGQNTPEGLKYIGNENYSIVTNIQDFGKISVPFGNKYGFYLADGLIGSKRDYGNTETRKHIPEYLIISDYFIQMAKEYDLEVVLDQNFHSFYANNIKMNKRLFDKMRFNLKNGPFLMDEALWECSYLYKVLMLRKKTGVSMKINKNRKFQHESYWEIRNDYDDLYSDQSESD